MITNFPSIKPEKHYMRLSSMGVFSGQQILNLLKETKSEPAMQAFILLDSQETDKPISRFGKYGTEIGW